MLELFFEHPVAGCLSIIACVPLAGTIIGVSDLWSGQTPGTFAVLSMATVGLVVVGWIVSLAFAPAFPKKSADPVVQLDEDAESETLDP